MATRHRSTTSMSALSTQRPVSRASTTSATSHHDAQQDPNPTQPMYMSQGPEAALLQYHASENGNVIPQFQPQQQQQAHHMAHHHAQSISFPVQPNYSPLDSPYLQEAHFIKTVRNGSEPISQAPDMPDEKRRKVSAVTATNDKELREMLARNEGRPLPEVAQEVIQKERTPMAEKTKQLFAMLWYVVLSLR
jgi:regulatory factor X